MLGLGASLRLWKKEKGIRQTESCSVKRSASSQENQCTDLKHVRCHSPVQKGMGGGGGGRGVLKKLLEMSVCRERSDLVLTVPSWAWGQGLSLPGGEQGSPPPRPPVYRLCLWFAELGPAP